MFLYVKGLLCMIKPEKGLRKKCDLQGGCSFPIFSSCGLPAVLCVCLLLMSETRCSAALLYSVAITPCRNISLCLSNQTCRPALSSKAFRPGFVLAFKTREKRTADFLHAASLQDKNWDSEKAAACVGLERDKNSGCTFCL